MNKDITVIATNRWFHLWTGKTMYTKTHLLVHPLSKQIALHIGRWYIAIHFRKIEAKP